MINVEAFSIIHVQTYALFKPTWSRISAPAPHRTWCWGVGTASHIGTL